MRLLKDIVASAGIKGHITKDDMMQIILEQSAQYQNIHIEQITTSLYNFYYDTTPAEKMRIPLTVAQEIISNQRQENTNGLISRHALFPTIEQ